MDKKLVKKKAKLAIDMIEDIDESYKKNAFQVVFSKLLDSFTTNSSTAPKKSLQTKKVEDVDLEKNKKILSQKAGLTVAELEDIFDFGDNEIRIIAPLSGTMSEKRLVATQCILTAYRIILNREWVIASELAKHMKALSLYNSHLSRDLAKNKQTFREKGKTKSKKYRITDVGIKSSLNIIKDLARGTT